MLGDGPFTAAEKAAILAEITEAIEEGRFTVTLGGNTTTATSPPLIYDVDENGNRTLRELYSRDEWMIEYGDIIDHHNDLWPHMIIYHW